MREDDRESLLALTEYPVPRPLSLSTCTAAWPVFLPESRRCRRRYAACTGGYLHFSTSLRRGPPSVRTYTQPHRKRALCILSVSIHKAKGVCSACAHVSFCLDARVCLYSRPCISGGVSLCVLGAANKKVLQLLCWAHVKSFVFVFFFFPTGAYGLDCGSSLTALLTRLAKDVLEPRGDNSLMLRVGMSNPPFLLQQLNKAVEVFKHPNVFEFLHLPLQSGSNDVLKAMVRRTSQPGNPWKASSRVSSSS